ncbi:DUF4302 domain-containing protein [Flexithrix dorotheae]|uniref:DUF4302 domain-containing protein n=1 Tax=Flexithrix dorotheae TaxID=70993 RepID=UPI0003646173|nr:DUF4302 domain-containing protein [Flexithrix dorotheae]
MINRIFIFLVISFVLTLSACEEDKSNEDIETVESRQKAAKTELINELIAPADGWRISYVPADLTGVYTVLLKFDANGQVTIQSDVSTDDQDFFNQTIPYRIDILNETKLVFETYAVFHYLFELNQATFGGEFQFVFKLKDTTNNTLVFESASDTGVPSVITFERANPGDDQLLAKDVSTMLNKMAGPTPFGIYDPGSGQFILGGEPIVQHILAPGAVNGEDLSVFFGFYTGSRIVEARFAGVGTTEEEVLEGQTVNLDREFYAYSLQNNSIIFETPVSFSVGGKAFEITSIALTDFAEATVDFCMTEPEDGVKYTGSIPGIGNITMETSLADDKGATFVPQADDFYSVNPLFISTGGNGASGEASFEEKFNDLGGFIFYYGYEVEGEPLYAMGFSLIDSEGNSRLVMRKFEPTTTVGNKITINLLDEYYFDKTPDEGDDEKIKEITDELFDGGNDLYAIDIPIDDLTVYRLFNPCNFNEIILVK